MKYCEQNNFHLVKDFIDEIFLTLKITDNTLKNREKNVCEAFGSETKRNRNRKFFSLWMSV